jgi:MraZ protein
MELLTGEFNNTLDDKGRVSLPSRLRSGLPGNVLVLTQGVDNCLWLFPPEQWKELSRKLMESTSPFQAKSRMIQRRIIAPAQEVEIDKAGRIAVPQSLREFAGLSKECTILGIDKYIEIWDADSYRNYWNEKEEEFKEAAEELGDVFL